MKEKKDRVEDALAATRAAIDEGIVPGGGIALKSLISSITNVTGENSSQNEGISIIVKACSAPFNYIMENAGLNADIIWSKINSPLTKGFEKPGFNARSEEYTCMFKDGIIDPVKVTRIALEKAVSVAGTMLTTECIVTKIKDDNNKEAVNPMAGMGF